jgi:hypothetical protein
VEDARAALAGASPEDKPRVKAEYLKALAAFSKYVTLR